MKVPPNDFNHLWNDLPKEVRTGLAPYMIEKQILHLWQAKQVMLKAHEREIKEIDDWIANCERSLAAHRGGQQ